MKSTVADLKLDMTWDEALTILRVGKRKGLIREDENTWSVSYQLGTDFVQLTFTRIGLGPYRLIKIN